MVIYEVNLNIDADVYTEFVLWLREHVQEMLQFPGFIQASLFEEQEKAGYSQEKLTVQYQIENKSDLDRYFTEFASMMREKGLNQFKGKFSASRRIFNVCEVMQK